jgi:membrane-bound lytic murein transglycosylase D
MLRRLFLPALVGLTACAHAGQTPVAPAAPLLGPPSVAGPPEAPGADSGRVPSAPSQATPSSPTTTVRPAIRDTSTDEAFLDTLRLLSADSAVAARQAAPGGAGRAEATQLIVGPSPSAGTGAGPATRWDIDVERYTANDRVQYYLDYFRGRARAHFEVYLARLGRYESLLRSRLQAAGLPQDLVYLALIESGLNPNALSRRRAAGLWQFITATGRRYGLTVDPWVDERRDPWRSTDAAIRMLAELNDHFGSLYLAAAAYDAGPGKIQRGLNRYDFGQLQGNDLYFALADERFLRPETRDYVPKLIAAAMIAKEPAKWGFDHIDRWEPLRYDSIQVHDVVGLDVLGRLADTTQDAMEELNPQLVRRVTPPGRMVWVRVPAGKADSTAARLAVLPPERRVTHVEHYVARGETLGRIAQIYRVSVDDILGANPGVHPRSLRPGQQLVIPTLGIRSASRASHARSGRPQGTAASGATRPRYLVSTAARLPPEAGSRRVHIVKPGESAWTISRLFQVPLDALLKANGLTKRSLIKPGQAVRIPS